MSLLSALPEARWCVEEPNTRWVRWAKVGTAGYEFSYLEVWSDKRITLTKFNAPADPQKITTLVNKQDEFGKLNKNFLWEESGHVYSAKETEIELIAFLCRHLGNKIGEYPYQTTVQKEDILDQLGL